MAFEPAFMRDLPTFRAERERLRNLEDWHAFSAKWLDTETWPTKSADQVARESAGKPSPVNLGGRLWVRTALAYDISPEARYELMYTLKAFGDPIQFPLEVRRPKTPAIWSQECPYCELSTRDLGRGDTCPQCGRKLVYSWVAD